MWEDTLGNQFTEIYETKRCQRLRSREDQNFGGELGIGEERMRERKKKKDM
jgi:hypothetical protein